MPALKHGLPALVLLAAPLRAAEDAWIRRSPEPWSFAWEERLAAAGDGISMPGFGTWSLPVTAGIWGGAGVALRGASAARPTQLPGLPPLWRGIQVAAEAELWAASGAFYLHLHPHALLAADGTRQRTPASDPRSAWSGAAPEDTWPASLALPRGSAGVTALGHVLAVSTEPLRWGDGIFGGVVLGERWRGFPHLVLATATPVPVLPDLLGDEPPHLGHELVYGVLDGERSGVGRDVMFIGLRAALRWRNATVSYAKAAQFDGTDEPHLPIEHQAKLLWWRNGNEGSGVQKPDPNRMTSVGLRLDWGGRLSTSTEYGIDDPDPDDAIKMRWSSAAWTATIDWLDITGDGTWRAALEWFRSESYFYDHATYGAWDHRGVPLGHADGGNANSLRLLVQHLHDDGGQTALVAGWRRQGWRNAEDANPNSDRLGSPGPANFAPRPYDRLSLDGRASWPLDGAWTLSVESGVAWEANRNFADDPGTWDANAGAGLRRDW